MTRRTRAAWGLLVATLLCAGCGTIGNLAPNHFAHEDDRPPPTRVYGGVRAEWDQLRTMRFDDVYRMNLIFLPVLLADIPLTLVGDTVTLPYTVSAEVVRAINAFYFPEPAAEPERP